MSLTSTTEAKPDAALDVARLRRDFPILARKIRNKPLVYLDNAASAQKPLAVIDAIRDFYMTDYANIHRGVHLLSQRATAAYDAARVKVQRFLNAAESDEIVFVRGATEGINLVASSFGGMRVGEGDEVIVSAMEHHSNIVPWQMLCEAKGARLRVIPMTDDGELVLDEYEKLLNERTRLVGIVHVSNALGTVNPVKEMIRTAHEHDVPVLIDGAQAAPHMPVDVQDMDCDFYVFSGHKVFGPSGVGALYGQRRWLEAMPPYQGGGDMIDTVRFEGSTYAGLPNKFEAGTPNIADVVGLGAAIDYVTAIGMDRIAVYEGELLDYAHHRMAAVEGVQIVGTAPEKAGVLSFVMQAHPHDIGTILDMHGIAIRAGHHCAMPVMERLGLMATARASFAFYNTKEEIDRLAATIPIIREMFG